MQYRTRLLTVCLCVILCACAAPPVAKRPPEASEGAGVGIDVKIAALVFPAAEAQTVYFVRLSDDGKPLDDTLYASNYFLGGRAYLLGVPPGQYAAIAAVYSQTVLATTDNRVAYFPQPLIDMSIVSSKAGEVAYAGTYVVSITMPGVCPPDADEAQLRYAELMAPGVPKCGLLRILLHDLATRPTIIINSQVYLGGDSTYHHRGTVREAKHSATDGSDFFAKAREDLRDTAWVTPSK